MLPAALFHAPMARAAAAPALEAQTHARGNWRNLMRPSGATRRRYTEKYRSLKHPISRTRASNPSLTESLRATPRPNKVGRRPPTLLAQERQCLIRLGPSGLTRPSDSCATFPFGNRRSPNPQPLQHTSVQTTPWPAHPGIQGSARSPPEEHEEGQQEQASPESTRPGQVACWEP